MTGRTLAPPRGDLVLAVVLALLAELEVWLVAEVDVAVGAPLVAVAAIALAWRRVAPLAVAVVALGATVGTSLLGVPIDSLNAPLPIMAIAIYTLGAHAARARSWVGLGLSLATVWAAIFANEGPGADNLAFGLIVVGGPWLTGTLVRKRTDHAVDLALRAQELERSQAEREAAAVAHERARIARELHDVIAHSVSVMTVQAGAVEEIVDADPAQAREAANAIRQTGRDALVDLRRLLGLLRDDEHARDAHGPQPGLSELDRLAEQVRRAGVDVRVEVEGSPRQLPPGVDLSAFRVVQEALTNTLKHASAGRAVVAIRHGPEGVDIEVTDDGVGGSHAGEGHGLIGMRERITLYGGQLEYGPGPGGGFRVHALLPVEGGLA